MFQRRKEEKLHGVGMLVVADTEKPYEQYSSFNQKTLSRYVSRKRQFNDQNYIHESELMKNNKTEPSRRGSDNYSSAPGHKESQPDSRDRVSNQVEGR